jgi:hypothetical protein
MLKSGVKKDPLERDDFVFFDFLQKKSKKTKSSLSPVSSRGEEIL